jgi:hypothetical protein
MSERVSPRAAVNYMAAAIGTATGTPRQRLTAWHVAGFCIWSFVAGAGCGILILASAVTM